MKKIQTLAVLLACWCGAFGQNKGHIADSAEYVVNRFLNIQNSDALKGDSILYMETYIYYRSSPHDTAILKRWFLPPNRFRAELWHGDTLTEGVYSDGKKIFRECNIKMLAGWTRVADSRYYTIAPTYDFRGELYSWKADAAELTYKGIWNFNGHEVYRILVETPDKYNKYYLFEKESGILFFIEETNEHSEYNNHQAYSHPDWHAFHEYQPIGNTVLPSVESYQIGNDMLFYFTHYKLIPINMDIFTKD